MLGDYRRIEAAVGSQLRVVVTCDVQRRMKSPSAQWVQFWSTFAFRYQG